MWMEMGYKTQEVTATSIAAIIFTSFASSFSVKYLIKGLVLWFHLIRCIIVFLYSFISILFYDGLFFKTFYQKNWLNYYK
jgi:uncharacterized membrane protein YfcA